VLAHQRLQLSDRRRGLSAGEFGLDPPLDSVQAQLLQPRGKPPTGKTISFSELEIVRYEDGRIVDLRQVADLASLMAQLEGDQG
jgi:hypothetical protein